MNCSLDNGACLTDNYRSNIRISLYHIARSLGLILTIGKEEEEEEEKEEEEEDEEKEEEEFSIFNLYIRYRQDLTALVELNVGRLEGNRSLSVKNSLYLKRLNYIFQD